MAQPEACIFDLDGVIVDTAKYHYQGWKRLADQLNIPFGKKENRRLKGVSRRESLQKILALDDRQVLEDKFLELMDQKNTWYRELIADLRPADMLPGVAAFLVELQDAGIRRAIGSSSKNAPCIVHALQLDETFGVVIDGNMVEKTKPDPEVFLKGAQKLNVAPAGCVVFEDAAHGIEAAHRAGMFGVGVGAADYLSEAEEVIPGFKKFRLENLLNALNNR